jgi:GNAT superfamily N-acetyltransferase
MSFIPESRWGCDRNCHLARANLRCGCPEREPESTHSMTDLVGPRTASHCNLPAAGFPNHSTAEPDMRADKSLRGDFRATTRRSRNVREGMHLVYEWKKGCFQVTTDQSRLDLQMIQAFLACESEWARGIPAPTVNKSIRNSLCFGLFEDGNQIGFARVISDRATIAYLGDVFVLPKHRRRGLATWLMKCVTSHPDLQNLRRWILLTKDAHGLYRKYGFVGLSHPESYMELHDPDVYGVRGTSRGARRSGLSSSGQREMFAAVHKRNR